MFWYRHPQSALGKVRLVFNLCRESIVCGDRLCFVCFAVCFCADEDAGGDPAVPAPPQRTAADTCTCWYIVLSFVEFFTSIVPNQMSANRLNLFCSSVVFIVGANFFPFLSFCHRVLRQWPITRVSDKCFYALKRFTAPELMLNSFYAMRQLFAVIKTDS